MRRVFAPGIIFPFGRKPPFKLAQVSYYGPDYMQQTITTITYVVRDYDEAITFFVEKLGFDLVEDTCLEQEQPGKRCEVVKPKGTAGCSLLLSKAVDDNQAVVTRHANVAVAGC